ncbi:MAG: CAAX protease [Corynebacteriales bacterium]|nr:CAAX protease [Mycobacteriales bacterium]
MAFPARFSTYLRQAGGDRRRALELHEWSAKMNAALLHDFGHLEVGIRNLYDTHLQQAVVAGENHWTDPATFLTLFPQRYGVDKRTHNDLATARQKAGKAAPPGKIIAELTFGFWVFLTANRHAPTIWTPYLEHAYPSGSLPGRIHAGLEELRKARNRVAHHEPAHVADVNKITRRVRSYALYISRDVADYIDHTSDVKTLLAARP